MAFGFPSLPTRKWKYAIRKYFQPRRKTMGTEIEHHYQLVRKQLWLAHCYHVKLVEIELARRNAANQCVRDMSPELVAAEEKAQKSSDEVAKLRYLLAQANIKEGKKVADKQLASLIKTKDAETKKLWKAATDIRKAAYKKPEVMVELAKLEVHDAELRKEARDNARKGDGDGIGLFWPTCAIVEQRVKKNGMPPRRPIFDGTGTIAFQMQRKADKNTESVPVLDSNGVQRMRNGKPMTRKTGSIKFGHTDFFTPNTRLYAEREIVDGKPHRRNVLVHFRVGSNPDDTPIFVKVPVVYHREIPQGGDVKWAYIHCMRVGTQFQYQLLLDIAKEEWEPKLRPATEGTVAVALGWRKIGDEIRVASWVGSDGRSGEVRIPEARVNQFTYCDTLRSIRDTNFNATKAELIDWLKSRDLPEEWKVETVAVHMWGSAKRLVRFVRWWREHRLEGDEEIYSIVNGVLYHNIESGKDWYSGGLKQDKHLYDWAEFQRLKAARWRKWFYLDVARSLARAYAKVATAEIDWHEIAENKPIESADENVFKTYRGIAACAKLRDNLHAYMTPIEVDPHNITVTCNKCKFVCESPKAKRLVDCPTCGRVDRAENAAKNLLELATGFATAPARVPQQAAA